MPKKQSNNTLTVTVDLDALGKIEADKFVVDPKVGEQILLLQSALRQLKAIEDAVKGAFMRTYDEQGVSAVESDHVRISVSKPAERLVLVDPKAAAKAGVVKLTLDNEAAVAYEKERGTLPPGVDVTIGSRRVTITPRPQA